MAKVTAPFLSTYATGSIGKTLNVRALYDGNKFVMAMHKQRAGKRSALQILNSQIFSDRMRAVTIARGG